MPVTFISVGDEDDDVLTQYLNTVNFLLSQDSPPQVLTTSYGGDEPFVDADLATYVVCLRMSSTSTESIWRDVSVRVWPFAL